MPENKLTDKQEMFCQEYIVDLNAAQASLRAGYKDGDIGRQLIRKNHVHARIEELQKSRLEKLQINQEWVLLRLIQISDRSMQAEEVMKFDYEEKQLIGTGEYQFDSNGANKATELIGKHLGMFRDKIDLTTINEVDTSKLTDEEKLTYLKLIKKSKA